MEKTWGIFISSGRFLKTGLGCVQAVFDKEAGGALSFGGVGDEKKISINTRVLLDCTYSESAGDYGQVWKVLTKTPDLKRNALDFSRRCFFAFMASDRGNILNLVRNPYPEDISMHASLCGHWIDLHLDILPEVIPVPTDTVYEVETVVEIYGDSRISDEEIDRIGRQALEMGEIVY
ncbi:hypothetical protein DRQ15_10155 [candidate division KSB1 bacterium]|nr:MAG: hypothetical protein DRQ15_10155 [candidate division KSB1 bacterium]